VADKRSRRGAFYRRAEGQSARDRAGAGTWAHREHCVEHTRALQAEAKAVSGQRPSVKATRSWGLSGRCCLSGGGKMLWQRRPDGGRRVLGGSKAGSLRGGRGS
jgi:hypothetical protein